MSVRVHELSKQIGMSNRELLELLRGRGYDVKTASSTVDNISAESLVEEFSKPEEPETPPESQEDSSKSSKPAESGGRPGATAPPVPHRPDAPRREETATGDDKAPAMPPGVFVKSREEVEKERQERVEEQRRARPVIYPPKDPPPQQHRRPSSVVAPPNAPPPVRTPGGPNRPGPGSTAPPRRSPGVTRTPFAPGGGRPPNAPRLPKAPGAPPKPPGAPPKAPEAPPAEPAASDDAEHEIKPPAAAEESAPETTDAVEAPASERKAIQMKSPIVVRDFATQLGVRPFQLISELMELNIFASMNQVIEEDVAVRVAGNHGFDLDILHRGKSVEEEKAKEAEVVDESEFLEPRSPVVCVLGHVDHGKTTLLDAIRKSDVAGKEAGGITQHIGAYQVEHKGNKITFLDTPGHAAFARMRQRGAEVTDIAILIVAADDGFMPQTDQALKFAQDNGVPVVVAINKMDMPGANETRVKQQMQQRGIPPEDLGGETLTVNLSAVKGEGIEELLDAILLQAEIMETLEANPKAPAEGIVIEAQKEVGRGSTATVIVQRGTLKRGDSLVCGAQYCRARALLDENGKQMKSAPPATPVKIMGWSDTPESGGRFTVVKNEKTAKRMAEETAHLLQRDEEAERTVEPPATLDELFAATGAVSKKAYRAVVKADVFGAVEALAFNLESIESEKIEFDTIRMGVGPVSRNDIMLADASGAVIVAFNVGLESGAAAYAKHHDVTIISHDIIYVLIDQVRDAMAELLEPETQENKLGAAEVRATFPISRGVAAGCMVTEGVIARDRMARVLRKGELVHQSRVGTLRRFKDDVNEVRAGYECGIRINGYDRYEEGDIIECFEILKIKPDL